MPVISVNSDHSPLFKEFELIINDEKLLAQQIGDLMLGHQHHVENILRAKKGSVAYSPNDVIDKAIEKLVVVEDHERYKRDGWIFQFMTWITLNVENRKVPFKCQIPHPAPAMHGIDGLGVVLSKNKEIVKIIISEDKYTENPRKKIKEEVWPEFRTFEERVYDSHIVSIVTGLIRDLSIKEINMAVQRDLYNMDLRTYRVGITPRVQNHIGNGKRRLFKGYDNCVKRAVHDKREALTFSQADIRDWMDKISVKISKYLTSKKI
ncbi:hypothetical protein [Flavobacterium sp. MDT1-60]|uniref:hypothetical protein n=1 Tax=Flavobacterium sp. MDT1-60 TaxID=1979344 RepID=UPI0017865933|nr:hypothetical protein [Flavobacterium sp. MDT1-60]QOG01079.1 hypothetical protein IHE43_14785 [Flavobacterium sp. MDT1-60]